MDKLLIDYGNQNRILNKALDVRQNWEGIQEKLNAAINEIEGYGSIAPDTVVLISEMSDEIRNIENNKATLQGFIASFSQYLDIAREVEEDLQLYINDSQGYTIVISSQIQEKERKRNCKFVIGGLIIIGSIALAIVCPATSPILANILTGMAIGSTTGGLMGAGLTAAFGGDSYDIADGFLAGTATGAIEGGLSFGTGYNGFAKYILKDFAIGTTADFGYGVVDAAIEGNPNGVIMGGFDQAFNPINMVTNLGTGMFGAGVGSGKIKLKMPEGLKVPEWVSNPFRKGAPSVTDIDKQIKNSGKIKNFIDRFTFNSNKLSSQLKRESPELYEKLKFITKDINNKKYVTMSMNGGGQLKNIPLEKVNQLAKEISGLDNVVKNCTDEGQLKRIVEFCDAGNVEGLRKYTEEAVDPVYTSFIDLMPPGEVVRYNKHWTGVAERISNEALDNQINFIKNGGITKPGGGAYKPAKIGAAVDMNTGDISFGYNGANKFNPSRDTLKSELQSLIDNTKSLAADDLSNPYAVRSSYELWSVDNCAEVYATNNALRSGVNIDNIFLNTKYFNNGAYAEPCANCKITFKDFGMPNK